jgi:hypothetical protein
VGGYVLTFAIVFVVLVAIIIGVVIGIAIGRRGRDSGAASGTPTTGVSAAPPPAIGQQRSWLDYGNIWITGLGIMLATLAFAFVFNFLTTAQPNDSGLFTDSSQVLAVLSAFFTIVGTLVGAFMAAKTGGDAAAGAQTLAGSAIAPGVIAPTVVAVSPPEGAQGVSADTDVTVTFSKDMSSLTITPSTFILLERDANVPVDASYSYDPTSKRAILNPDTALKAGTYYKVNITTGVLDTTGKGLPMSKTWDFKVA